MKNNIEREHILQLIKSVEPPHKHQKRDNAVAAMKRLDKTHLFAILSTLMVESDIEIRANVIEVALLIDRMEGVDFVLPILQNPKDEVRIHACGLMHSFGNEQVIKPLLKIMRQDPDAQVRGVAAYALGGIGNVQAIPELVWTEQNDHESDWSGHSPSSSATEAITNILKDQIINYVTEHPEQIIRKSFANDGQLVGQIIHLSSPFIDIRSSDNPYQNLPDEAFEPTETRDIDLVSLHPFPFAVETSFEHPKCKVERDFVFSYDDLRLTIVTIIKRRLRTPKDNP